jgi:hypothetical protein
LGAEVPGDLVYFGIERVTGRGVSNRNYVRSSLDAWFHAAADLNKEQAMECTTARPLPK